VYAPNSAESQRHERLIELVSGGRLHSFRALGRELGISHEWARQLVRRYRLTLPKPSKATKPNIQAIATR
jgi:hypothetical protein